MASAGQTTTGATPLLFAHVGLGAIVVGVTAWVLVAALKRRRDPGVGSTVFTAASVLATASTGAIFLFTDFPNGGTVDRLLALASLAGTVAMVVTGARRGPAEAR